MRSHTFPIFPSGQHVRAPGFLYNHLYLSERISPTRPQNPFNSVSIPSPMLQKRTTGAFHPHICLPPVYLPSMPPGNVKGMTGWTKSGTSKNPQYNEKIFN
jgi:hypothetical protein